MVQFKLNEPISTRDPVIRVDAGLPPGRYIFSLTVTDASSNTSQRSLHTVEILPERPIIDGPILDRPIIDSPIVDNPIIDSPILDRPVINNPIPPPIFTRPIDPQDPRLDAIDNPRLRNIPNRNRRRNRRNNLTIRERLRRFFNRP